ncbi:MAG: hypothetical protein P8H93_00710 [Polaribacter sp.]|nr:hypothetical protein [Polaribacter sp.]
MCGFIGEYTFNDSDNSDSKLFKSLLKLSSRRGLNHMGFMYVDSFQLGFNRLSFI